MKKWREDAKQRAVEEGYTCGSCGGDIRAYGTPQIAHRIPKEIIKKYGKEIIHHKLNTVMTCCLKCNSSVAIGKSKTMIIEKLVSNIEKEINNG